MSREKMVRAKSCGTLHIATAQLMVRIPPTANSYLPRNWLAGRRRTRPSRNQPQIMPQAPTVNRTVPVITPVSVVRNGANHWVALMTEFCAIHPTDNDPMVTNTEPSRPTAIAGQADFLVSARTCSNVVINSFPSDSLVSMTLGINVSPQVGRLSIDT